MLTRSTSLQILRILLCLIEILCKSVLIPDHCENKPINVAVQFTTSCYFTRPTTTAYRAPYCERVALHVIHCFQDYRINLLVASTTSVISFACLDYVIAFLVSVVRCEFCNKHLLTAVTQNTLLLRIVCTTIFFSYRLLKILVNI